jgi:DNA-binding NtrC family response regulator
VTDVVMPGINGIETAKGILKILPSCRIILFSGQAVSTGLVAQARSEGYRFEILAKPINPEVLLERLGNAPAETTG